MTDINELFDGGMAPPGMELPEGLVPAEQENPAAETEQKASEQPEEDNEPISLDSSDEAESHQDLAEEVDQQSDDSGKQDVVQQFIDSQYGGDKDKFVKSLFESRKEMGLLASQVRDLTQIVAQLNAEPDPQEAEEDSTPDPDVQLHEKQIARLDRRKASHDNKLQGTLQAVSEAAAELNRIEGALPFADDDAIKQLKADQSRLKGRLSDLQTRYRSQVDEAEDLLAEIDLENTRLDKARKASESARSKARLERQQAKQAEDQQVQTWRGEAWNAINAVVDGAKFIPAEERDEVKEQIRTRIGAVIRENGPVPDLAAFSKATAERHIKSWEKISRVKFTEASKAKVAASSNGRTRSNGSTGATTDKLSWKSSQADWDKAAAQWEQAARRDLARRRAR